MNKLILAYNFTGERLQALRLICMMLKVACRPVARGEMLQPMGYLAGVKGVEPVTEIYDGDEGTEEMLYLCGFDRAALDRLLAAIKKSKLQRVHLKSMMTPHNIGWNGLSLIKELGEEHAYMMKNGRPKPPEHTGAEQ